MVRQGSLYRDWLESAGADTGPLSILIASRLADDVVPDGGASSVTNRRDFMEIVQN